MDPAEFAAINTEMNEAIANMTPAEQDLHSIKVGQQLCRTLEDYCWDYTYGGNILNAAQIQAIQQADPTPVNMEFKVPMWLSEWKGFNYSTAAARECKQFADAVNAMRRHLAVNMPGHPANGRVQRWLMNRYDRQNKIFRYDLLDSQLPIQNEEDIEQ